MKENWHYRKQIGDAGLTKIPPRIKDLGEHSVRIFVREVIQNNLDAAINGEKVSLTIKVDEWDSVKIAEFFGFIGVDHIELLRRANKMADPGISPYLKACSQIINGKTERAILISVEERNCIGLIGPVRQTEKEKSHFDSLMRKVEDNGAKKETSNTGGTWGKGSSIFTYTSNLWTWFAYSKLSVPWQDINTNIEHKTRFIGRCMLAPFFEEEDNTSYLGDGWFCDIKQKIDAYPFLNEHADRFAKQLGIERNVENYGTSFYVPFFKPLYDSGVEIQSIQDIEKEFISQVMQNWFIPIYYEELEVIVKSEFNTLIINKEFIQSVQELKFKLQIIDWYDKGCPPDSRFLREEIEIELPKLKADFITDKNKFTKTKKKSKADFLIRIIDEEEIFIDNWKTVNKVALCRNRGMIVNDEELVPGSVFRTESILFGGLLARCETLLEARKHQDLFLAYSENPAHNTWCRDKKDYDKCYLERFEGQNPRPTFYINNIFIQIIKIFKKIFNEEAEDKENHVICSIFKKLAKLKSHGNSQGEQSIFAIRKLEELEIDLQGRYIFRRRIISNSEKSKIEILFSPYLSTLEGEINSDFDALDVPEFNEIDILDMGNNLLYSGNKANIILEPRQEIDIKIRTCSIDTNPYFKNIDPLIKISGKLI